MLGGVVNWVSIFGFGFGFGVWWFVVCGWGVGWDGMGELGEEMRWIE